jgi:hypothetical protein
MAVFKIAKPNGTVDDSEKDLVMTSDRACIIEMFSGIEEITTDDDGNGTTEITHNLGYVPMFFCFDKGYLDTTYWYPMYSIYAKATTTKLILEALYLDANTTYQCFYSIAGNRNDNAVGSGNSNVTGKIKIAKSGYDAEYETDIRNMNFVSGYNVWKVDTTLSGSFTVDTDGDGAGTFEITHGLGYVPMVFILNTDEGKMLPYTVPLFGGVFMLYWLDSNKIYGEISGADPSTTLNFKYKVLRDKIQ